MSEITKDPALGTNTAISNGAEPSAPYGRETVSSSVSPAAPAPNPQVQIPEPQPQYAQPSMQQPFQNSMPQNAAPQMAAPQPQYTQPPVQQPSYHPYVNPASAPYPQQPMQGMSANTKFCKFCAARIPMDAVVCTACGRQVEQFAQPAQQPVVINNTNTNVNRNTNQNAVGGVKPLNKWTAFFLCLFLGYLGVHKFYEGRILTGILYLCTFGVFGFGWLLDTLILLCKPNPYYVK